MTLTTAVERFLAPTRGAVERSIEYALLRTDNAQQLRQELKFTPDFTGTLSCPIYGHTILCVPHEGAWHFVPNGKKEHHTCQLVQVLAFILATNW
jgi:hypothetical protein